MRFPSLPPFPFFGRALALVTGPTWLQAQNDDGVFAAIETSMGTIRARLASERAPIAVSNFVGLVEGTQKGLDTTRGQIIEGGYFDGNLIHRVEPNKWMQTGSRSGMLTDGPGYRFQSEFDPDLSHAEPYRLSMVSSAPNQNGSQFVITAAPADELDGIQTVFGEVVDGREIVDAITGVETDAEGRPLTPVTIEHITIERLGPTGSGFQLNLAALPQIGFTSATWEDASQGNRALSIPYQLNAEYRLLQSSDLLNWTDEVIGFFQTELPTSGFDVSERMDAHAQSFFRVVEARYPIIVYTPENLSEKQLDARITLFGEVSTDSALSYAFSSTTAGSARLGSGGTPVNFRNYFYNADSPTQATLVVPSELSIPFNLAQFALTFASHSSGTFTAVLPSAFPAPTIIAGSFTLHDR